MFLLINTERDQDFVKVLEFTINTLQPKEVALYKHLTNFIERNKIMKKSLADLASAFANKTNDNGGGNQTWKLFFNFWKMDVDSVSTVRFLPDADEENPMGFLVENLSHELVINGKREKVACLKMYGEDCPVCALSQKYYDEKSPDHNEKLGKKYYRKKSYIGQALVIDTTIEHDQEQLVKLMEFGPKIFKQIQAAFASGDLEEAPYELKGGYNFRIKKSKSGEYADYGTSSFSPKQSDVADDIIESMSLYDLKEYRTPKVTREVLEAMLLADQTGGSFSAEKSDDAAPKQETKTPAPKADKAESAEKSEDAAPAGEKKLSVVEQLRARAAAKAE